MYKHVINYTTRPLSEFTPEDTIYIRKMDSGGRAITYLAQFISYTRGNVRGKIIDFDPEWAKPTITEVGARAKNTYLWGISAGEDRERCHWFKDGTFD